MSNLIEITCTLLYIVLVRNNCASACRYNSRSHAVRHNQSRQIHTAPRANRNAVVRCCIVERNCFTRCNTHSVGIAEFAGLEIAGLENDGLENDGVEQSSTSYSPCSHHSQTQPFRLYMR